MSWSALPAVHSLLSEKVDQETMHSSSSSSSVVPHVCNHIKHEPFDNMVLNSTTYYHQCQHVNVQHSYCVTDMEYPFYDESLAASEAEKKRKKPSIRTERSRLSHILKEHERCENIRKAFQCLQGKIPHLPNDYAVARIKTLRLAIQYIRYLQLLLIKGSMECATDSHFAKIVAYEVSRKNTYATDAMIQLKKID
ncbi:Heart- and neural crest derivatives-expressed protein 1 [Trichinella britovi]|uniref:Heart-and neural crest derivatives-expressed protein 1 n=2 Tax=Trichinella TaxID=6333 RepID=A0A0V1CQE9_TRIBR|nr:Heart- and neural crest derivatives-expressed protein 1 [Trichinella murrelli]KRY50947.1 Heart- and neural crest derivatives-expressed protein 1 [Trichinella britovi]